MLASEPNPQRPASSFNQSRSPSRPLQPPRRPIRRQPSRGAVAIALETSTKLAVNLILVAMATSAVVRLVPYYRSVQEKLASVQIQVDQTQERVNQLQLDFDRSFDPQQAKQVMAEQSHQINPQRRSVVWKQGTPESKRLSPRPR